MELKEIIARNISKYIKLKNVTVLDLSKVSKISQKRLQASYYGNNLPSLTTLYQICNSLNIEITELLPNKREIELVFNKIDVDFNVVAKNRKIEQLSKKLELLKSGNCEGNINSKIKKVIVQDDEFFNDEFLYKNFPESDN